MSLPPAAWFDDPERPDMYRYWDGSAWTDHRSPKGGPPAYDDTSGTGIIASGWDLFKDNWTPLLGIGALTFLGVLAGGILILIAAVTALDPNALDIAERVLQSDFNPDSDPLDQAYLDNIDFDFTASFVVLALTGALVVWLSAIVGAGTGTLLLGSRHHGHQMGIGACFRLAFRRLPRWIGISLLWGIVSLVPVVLLWTVAIAVAPILLVAVIPVTIAAVIYLFPIATIAGGGLFLGPINHPPFRSALALVKPQWGTVAVRVLVVNLILFAISLVLGVVNLIPILGVFINLAGQFVYYGLQTATSVKLYASVDAPFTEDITSNDEPSGSPSTGF